MVKLGLGAEIESKDWKMNIKVTKFTNINCIYVFFSISYQ